MMGVIILILAVIAALFAIVSGLWVAHALVAAISSKRPLTHDLLRKVIESLGGKVKKIAVTELIDQTFYAKISIELKGSILEIDARPSDSIALALKTGVPNFVAEDLFRPLDG